MAGWLSSKLKEAEQFLQQIDQQAAESLGKPEKQRSIAFQNTGERHGSVSEKPKQPSGILMPSSQGEKLEPGPESFSTSLNRLTKSAHDNRGFNNIARPKVKDQRVISKKLSSPVFHNGEDFEGVGRDDWTELLASPNINSVSSPALASSVGSSDSCGIGSQRVSSRIVSNAGRNGGNLQQSAGSSSRNISASDQAQKVPSHAHHTKLQISLSDANLMDSENASSHRSFRNETLRRRLELGTSHNSGIEGDIKVGVIDDALSTTGNNIGMNVHSTEVNDRLLVRKSALPSRGEAILMDEDSHSDRRGFGETKVSDLLDTIVGDGETVRKDILVETTQVETHNQAQSKDWQCVRQDLAGSALDCIERAPKDSTHGNGFVDSEMISWLTDVKEHKAHLEVSCDEEKNKLKENVIVNAENGASLEPKAGNVVLTDKEREPLGVPSEGQLEKGLEAYGRLRENSEELSSIQTTLAVSGSDVESYESGSDTETESAAGSESEDEEIERRKAAHKQRIARRKEIAAAKAAAAQAAIKEREEFVQKLEKEKIALEHILAGREEQRGKEAAELRLSTVELLQALELEKQQHSATRMEALAKESQLESQNAELAKSLGAFQWELEVQISEVSKSRNMVEAKDVIKADLERKLAKLRQMSWSNQHSEECKTASRATGEEFSFEEELAGFQQKIEQCQIQVKEFERKLGDLKDSRCVSTQTEIELENHLTQLTDHLIQKQAQVEALSTERATLAIRLEALSNTLQEERAMALSRASRSKMGFPKSFGLNSFGEDIEYGLSRPYSSKSKPSAYDVTDSATTVGNMGSNPLSPVLVQLDAVFSAGLYYLRRHRSAQMFAIVYMIGLHVWVLFILFMHSKPTETLALQDLALPQNISGLSGGSNSTTLF